MTPLNEYLLEKLNASGGNYHSTAPQLGVAGESRLAGLMAGFFISRELTEQEYGHYQSASKVLGKHATGQQLIHIARLNFNDYGAALEKFGQEYAANYDPSWGRVVNMIIEVNRHVLNFLSAMKTFLDHTETRLKREHGDTSTGVQVFKDASARAFDGHFSYRFIYQLRNYTQHCGMPLGVIRAKSDLPSSLSGPAKHAIDFYFEKASLLANFSKWGKHVQPELEAMPDVFPLTPHLKQTMACLDDIHHAVMSEAVAEIESQLSLLDPLLNELPSEGGMPCVYTKIAITINAHNVPVSDISFQRFQMQHIEETRVLLREYAAKEARRPEWEKYAEGWDRIFGKKAT
jgi:hypothetical protein